MKKNFLPILVCLFFIQPLRAQHFVGDMSFADGNTAVFTIKPQGGDITNMISVVEYYMRWDESFGNNFTFSSIVNNTTDFPGINVVTANNDVTDAGFNNQHFSFTGLTTTTKTYVQDSTYEVFRVTVSGTIPPAFHLVANNQTGVPYYFTVRGDGGTDYTPYDISPFVNPTDSAGAFYYKTYMYSILSVGLISFNGTISDCNAHLNWVTASETPGGRFEVQQSRDGGRFNTVKTIQASGNPNGYDYHTSVPLLSGYNYFRLKIINGLDREEYSQIILLKSDCSGIYMLQAAPNPVVGGIANLLVTVGDESDLDIRLLDLSGKFIKQYSRHIGSGTSKVQLELPKITAGQYFITIFSPGRGKTTQKIFVQ